MDIGITTGNNDYFSVNNSLVTQYNLKNAVLPLIGRSAHSKGLYFTQEDWLDNVENGLNAQLINFPDIPYENYPQEHKSYIELGEKEEVNKGYKCSIRNRWYRIPSIYAPDAFFLRRNNQYPKFVLNSINAVSTDTMHRIRFKENINPEKHYYHIITALLLHLQKLRVGVMVGEC